MKHTGGQATITWRADTLCCSREDNTVIASLTSLTKPTPVALLFLYCCVCDYKLQLHLRGGRTQLFIVTEPFVLFQCDKTGGPSRVLEMKWTDFRRHSLDGKKLKEIRHAFRLPTERVLERARSLVGSHEVVSHTVINWDCEIQH